MTTKPKKRTYDVEVTRTIVISGWIEVEAEDEEEAEAIAYDAMPEITWNVPDGFDSDDHIDVEVKD